MTWPEKVEFWTLVASMADCDELILPPAATPSYRRQWHLLRNPAKNLRIRGTAEEERARVAAQRREHYLRNREQIVEKQRESRRRNPRAGQSQARYRQRNRDYVTRRAARYEAQYAAIPAPRRGSAWTPAEDAIVCRTDLSVKEVCYMTGRGYKAVVARRTLLESCGGQIAYHPDVLPWSDAELHFIATSDLSIAEMSSRLSRTPKAIVAQRRTLRRNGVSVRDNRGKHHPNRRVTADTAAAIRRLHAEGKSTSAIARAVELSWPTVRRVIAGTAAAA